MAPNAQEIEKKVIDELIQTFIDIPIKVDFTQINKNSLLNQQLFHLNSGNFRYISCFKLYLYQL